MNSVSILALHIRFLLIVLVLTSDSIFSRESIAVSESGTEKRDIEVLISVLSRRSAFDNRQAIRETWASGHNNVVFVVGSCCPIKTNHRHSPRTCTRKYPSSHNTQSLMDKQCAEEDKLLAKEQERYNDVNIMDGYDVYRYLPQKLKFIYQWGLQHTTARWFVKADDDQFIRVHSLVAMLKFKYNPSKHTVIGKLRKNNDVRRSGKWIEVLYKKDSWNNATYPTFPVGSASHTVSWGVASYIAKNADNLTDYNGEDTSLGIWIDEAPFGRRIKWVDSQLYLGDHKNCNDTSLLVIGHKIWPQKMRECYAHGDEVV